MSHTKKYSRTISVDDMMEAEWQIQQVFDELLKLNLPDLTKSIKPAEVADSPAKNQEFQKIEVVTDDSGQEYPPITPPSKEEVTEVGKKKYRDVAKEIARVGDQLVSRYGEKVQSMEFSLQRLVTDTAADAAYTSFSSAMDKVVGEEKTWTNFMIVMCLSKRMVSVSSSAGSALVHNFRRYLGTYTDVVAESGGVANFVQEHRAMQQ